MDLKDKIKEAEEKDGKDSLLVKALKEKQKILNKIVKK